MAVKEALELRLLEAQRVASMGQHTKAAQFDEDEEIRRMRIYYTKLEEQLELMATYREMRHTSQSARKSSVKNSDNASQNVRRLRQANDTASAIVGCSGRRWVFCGGSDRPPW